MTLKRLRCSCWPESTLGHTTIIGETWWHPWMSWYKITVLSHIHWHLYPPWRHLRGKPRSLPRLWKRINCMTLMYVVVQQCLSNTPLNFDIKNSQQMTLFESRLATSPGITPSSSPLPPSSPPTIPMDLDIVEFHHVGLNFITLILITSWQLYALESRSCASDWV